jgi:Zn-dependent M32 family carboxypeptidase
VSELGDDFIGDDPDEELICDVKKAKRRTEHYTEQLHNASDFMEELLEHLDEAAEMERVLQDAMHEAREAMEALVEAVEAGGRTPRIDAALVGAKAWLKNR